MNNVLKKLKHNLLGVLRLVPLFDLLFVYFFARLRGNKIKKFKPCSMKNYAEKNANIFTIVETSQDRMVYEPSYFKKSIGREFNFNSPCIYYTVLEKVSVQGGTGIVLLKNLALTDICENDKENRVKYTSEGVRRGNKKAFYLELSNYVSECSEAVNLCGLAADNYYHLTVELLSRFEYIKDYIADKDIPILLDDAVKKYPQFVELTETILKQKKIIYVPKYGTVRCEKLIYPSMNTWLPINTRKPYDFRLMDNIISRSAIDNIRHSTQKYFSAK